MSDIVLSGWLDSIEEREIDLLLLMALHSSNSFQASFLRRAANL